MCPATLDFSVTFQKIVLFIVTVVRTSDQLCLLYLVFIGFDERNICNRFL
jgi:hypothetical protein